MRRLQPADIRLFSIELPEPQPAEFKYEENCDPYVLGPFSSKDKVKDDQALETIGNCLNYIDGALKKAADAASSADLNADIIQLRINYKRLKRWIPDPAKPPSSAWLKARKAELQVGQQLPATLKKHDLFATFSAVLVTAASIVDASQPKADASQKATAAAASTPQKADSAEQGAQGLGLIVWQSRHFGDESLERFDWSLGGKVGVQPVLNLVTATPAADAAADAPAEISAVHQNAFVWSAASQLNVPVRGINSEYTFYGSLGSSTLTTLPKAVDKGQGSFVAFPLDYGAEKTAWQWEAGAAFNIFDNRLEQIHAEKGTTSPQFQALVAFRRDGRFQGTAYSNYENPMGRLVFRLTLDAIRVLDRRQFGEASKPFTFGFVVEHERSLAGSGLRVPSATRFVLRGDINLLRALTGEAVPKETKTVVPVTTTWTVTLPSTRTLALPSKPKAVTVGLTKTVASGSESVTMPAKTVKVELDKPAQLVIPACPTANLSFSLTAEGLTLTTDRWTNCGVTSATFTIQEGENQG